MIIHIIFFLIICILSINLPLRIVINKIGQQKKIKNYHPWIIVLIFLTIIIGLRYQVGTDYMDYVQIFEHYKTGIDSPNLELGYELINKLVILLGLNYWAVFLISAFLTNFLVLKFFHEQSKSFFLSVVILFGIGFIFFQTNGVRQAIAIGLTFYGTKFLINRNLKKYILFCFLAMLFHYSAVIMIPMYWLANIRWRKTTVVFVLLIALVLFLSPRHLENILSYILKYFTPSTYRPYLNRVFSLDGNVNTGLRIIVEILLAIGITLFLPSKIKYDLKGKIYYNLCIYGFLSKIFLGRFFVVGRLSHYLLIYQTIFIPYFISYFKKNKTLKLIFIYMTLIFYGTATVVSIIKGSHDIIPYRMIFFI